MVVTNPGTATSPTSIGTETGMIQALAATVVGVMVGEVIVAAAAKTNIAGTKEALVGGKADMAVVEVMAVV